MNNEKGITLIELLVAIVIAGIVIVPLLTVMTGTFTRTLSQGKETEIAYVAQKVMENVRLDSLPELKSSGCWTNISVLKDGCGDLIDIDLIDTAKEIFVEVSVEEFDENNEYNEVSAVVMTPTKIINGPNDGVLNKDELIELVTVVEK